MPLSSSGLGHQALILKTGVRFPVAAGVYSQSKVFRDINFGLNSSVDQYCYNSLFKCLYLQNFYNFYFAKKHI